MSTVLSSTVYSPQNFVEFLTGKCFGITSPVIDCIHNLLKECGITEELLDYELSDIDEIVENNIPVVLVDVTDVDEETGYLKSEYRWFQLPSDFSSNEDCKNGVWLPVKDEEDLFYCSVCGYKKAVNNETDLPNYCEVCGVCMSETEELEEQVKVRTIGTLIFVFSTFTKRKGLISSYEDGYKSLEYLNMSKIGNELSKCNLPFINLPVVLRTEDCLQSNIDNYIVNYINRHDIINPRIVFLHDIEYPGKYNGVFKDNVCMLSGTDRDDNIVIEYIKNNF